MRKILALIFVLCMVPLVSANTILPTEEYVAMDFRYNADGVITDYLGTSDYLRIPSEIDNTPITGLGEYAFSGDKVKSVLVEEGIQTIGIGCFEGADIEDIDLPETITYISEKAFANCMNLANVWINSYNFEMADGAFADTGFIEFCMHCSLTDVADSILKKAKGDDNCKLQLYHPALVESMEEKDMWGNKLSYCELCGFKGSKYLSDRKMPFTDVGIDTWYYAYVLTAYEFGILNGKTQTTFDPDAKMTLAEAVKIAACVYDYIAGIGADFTADTNENWYQPYLDFCYKNYIIDDYITFSLEEPATRAQMAYLFTRADFNPDEPYYMNPDVPLTDIPDVYDTTPFAYEILELYRRGVATGGEYMAFYPDSAVKRSEAAAFISRIICYDMRIDMPKG